MILGPILVVLGIPLLLGIVKPNRFYGFRTGATLRDDRKWYQANVFSGGALVLCGLAISILSLLLAPLSHGALAYGDYKLLQGASQVGPLLLMLVAHFVYNKLH